jgi:phosphoribosyl 1,2-cyclic phosphodiesterase
MEITFYGVRGTVPVPGTTTNEFGGNTSCVHVRTKKGYDVILDSGTGICSLARKLMPTPLGKGKGEASILLSHTHWDHIQGFPFFIPVFIPGNTIRIFGRHPASAKLEEVLDGQLNKVYSPICSLSNLSASIEIHEIDDRPFALDGVSVTGGEIPHGKLTSTAFRIEEEGKTLVYMTDVEHADGRFDPDVLELARDSHILIHDSQYMPEDYESARGRGHSSVAGAVAFAREAKVRQLVTFHYSPDYDDNTVRRMYENFKRQPDLTVIAAQEGLKLVL